MTHLWFFQLEWHYDFSLLLKDQTCPEKRTELLHRHILEQEVGVLSAAFCIVSSPRHSPSLRGTAWNFCSCSFPWSHPFSVRDVHIHFMGEPCQVCYSSPASPFQCHSQVRILFETLTTNLQPLPTFAMLKEYFTSTTLIVWGGDKKKTSDSLTPLTI